MRIYLVVLFIGVTSVLKAQCDSSSDMHEVFKALDLDADYRFLQKTVLHLRPRLDSESRKIVKEGLSRKYYVRQLNITNHYVFDTLYLTASEIVLLDSFARNFTAWKQSDVAPCRIGRPVQIFTKSQKNSSSGYSSEYQILKPIFLRNRTLALIFYKRDIPDHYAEFTILMKTSAKWEIWKKVITIYSPTSAINGGK